MTFDYFTMLNPKPIFINGLGTLNKTKLIDIAEVTYPAYKSFLSMLLLDLATLYKSANLQKYEWYMSLDDEQKNELSLYDEIISNESLQRDYVNSFNFFIKENVDYDKENSCFIVSIHNENSSSVIGCITKETFPHVCRTILELHRISTKKPKKKVFKNKLAERVWKMTHKEDSENVENVKLDLGNLISSLASFNKGCNIINIWEMTVFQLYDQFQREDYNVYYNISSRSVSIWGDKENKHDFSKWYENIFADLD